MIGIPAVRRRADGTPIGPCCIVGFVWDGKQALAVAADVGPRAADGRLYAEYIDNFEVDLGPRPVAGVPFIERPPVSWWERLLGR